MEYYYSKSLKGNFEEVIGMVKESLSKEGFGVLTEIDVRKTMKAKLDIDFRNYVILGACNPPSAYKALTAEDKIGVLLPCNVIVQEKEENIIEVATVDPLGSMQAVDNPGLGEVAVFVREKLIKAVDALV